MPASEREGGTDRDDYEISAEATSVAIDRVDEQANRVVAQVPIGGIPDAIVAAAGSVWALAPQEGRLWQIDPRRNSVVGSISVPGASLLATAGATVWVADAKGGTIIRVVPRSTTREESYCRQPVFVASARPRMTSETEPPRIATVADVQEVAALLDRFNREFDTPSPGPNVLTARLERLLSGQQVVALLVGDPAVAVALLTLRPNVWSEGPVALLDELYVAPAQRRRGIGTALLKAAEAVVRERGGELLEINVDGEDTDARRFYERHGYTNHDPDQTQPQLYYHRYLLRRS